MGALMSSFGKDKPEHVATRRRNSTQRQREARGRKKVKVYNIEHPRRLGIRSSGTSAKTLQRSFVKKSSTKTLQRSFVKKSSTKTPQRSFVKKSSTKTQQNYQQQQPQQEASNTAGGGQQRNVHNKRQNVRGRLLAAPQKKTPGTSKMNHKADKESGEDSGVVAVAAESSTAAKDGDSPMQKVRKLEMEKQRLLEEKLCKICLDQQIEVSFVPCGHFVSCMECARALKASGQLKKCPICRAAVKGTQCTYMT